jgi:hypothetical protein
MSSDSLAVFEAKVRDYVAGGVDWEQVHDLAVDMSEDEYADFPPLIRRLLEGLHLNFSVPDPEDDIELRAEDHEILDLLNELDRLRTDISELGADVVAEREQHLEEEREQRRRQAFVDRHNRKRKR